MEDAELLNQLNAKAEAGDLEAVYEIGWRSSLGMGLPQDDAKGLEYLRRAAEGGHMLARNNLGARFLAGDGVDRDPIEAWKWFSLAAAQGDRKAAKNRDAVAASFTPEELQSAQTRLKNQASSPE